MLPLCQKLAAATNPILISPDSSCGQQLTAWEAELNIQARAISPMRFDCGMAAIKLQHEGPYRHGYNYLFMEAQHRREQEFYSRPFVFYEWLGTDYKTQKRQYEEAREQHRIQEAAILRDLSKRTPYNCPNWTEEDWDREDAEFASEWQLMDRFATRYLLSHLRKLYLYPFSAVYRMDFRVRFTSYCSWWKRRKKSAAQFREHLEVRRHAREAWRKRKAEHAEYVEFLTLSRAVHGDVDSTSLYLTYCDLKKDAGQGDPALQNQLEALRKAARQRVLVQSARH